MFYLLYGENTDSAREKAHELVDTLRAKRPDASFFKIEASQFTPATLDELVASQGLFEKKYIVLFDRVFENKEAKEEILEKRTEIAESPNIFIFLEGKIDKASLTKLEKQATKTQVFGKVADDDASAGSNRYKDFNIFSLADAVGNRDRKNAWLLYQKAVMQEIPAEEIHGVLWWAVKSMILASSAKTAGEVGLNPYVFQKSERFAKNFSEAELRALSSQLVSMYHDAHRGVVNFDIELEKLVLGV